MSYNLDLIIYVVYRYYMYVGYALKHDAFTGDICGPYESWRSLVWILFDGSVKYSWRREELM